MRTKKELSKKNKDNFTSFAKMFGKILIFYLVTVGQVVVSAHEIRKTTKKQPNSKTLGKLEEHSLTHKPQHKEVVQKTNSPAETFQNRHMFQVHKFIDLVLPQDQVQKKFKDCLRTYAEIMSTDILTQMGIQVNPQPHGLRFDRDVSKLVTLSQPNMPSLLRKRALSDPFYSLLLSKDYTQRSSIHSFRITEIFVYQAMLQVRTQDEVILVNRAYAELTALDMPENLRDALFRYRELLIAEYSLSNPGLCREIQEGGAIYTRYSDPELFEFHSVVIRMDHSTTLEFLKRNPSIQRRLEVEAVEKQNEFASGDLALLAMSSKDYLLGLALDIQRVLQYRKCSSVIRLYQLALRRLEQLLESPAINFRDLEIIKKMSFLDVYYSDRKLTENEQVVFSKYSNLLQLAENKVATTNLKTSNDLLITYILPLPLIIGILYMIFYFTRGVIGKNNKVNIENKNESKENENKKQANKGSLKKRKVFSELKTITDQKSEALYQENAATIKKQKFNYFMNRLKIYSDLIPKLDDVKKYLEIQRDFLNKRLDSLSQNVSGITYKPRDKAETDNVKQAEKMHSQQKRSIKHNVRYYEDSLKSINIFINTVNNCVLRNYTIDAFDNLVSTISSLSQIYENIKSWREDIASDLEDKSDSKNKDNLSKIKMLEYYKTMAIKLVPPLAHQVSQQLSSLKSTAEESNVAIDFKDLDATSNELLNALSILITLVSIDYTNIDETKFEEHVQQVLKAQIILDPSHPLRSALELSYQKTEALIYSSKSTVCPRSELCDFTEESVKSFEVKPSVEMSEGQMEEAKSLGL